MAAVRVLVGLSLLLVGFPRDARALPAFARRFNLACGACHSAVPRLNAWGGWDATLFVFAGAHVASALCWLLINPDGVIGEPGAKQGA